MSMQDVDAYVRERAAPPGSVLYYCALFVSPEQARLSLALEAFRRGWASGTRSCPVWAKAGRVTRSRSC